MILTANLTCVTFRTEGIYVISTITVSLLVALISEGPTSVTPASWINYTAFRFF